VNVCYDAAYNADANTGTVEIAIIRTTGFDIRFANYDNLWLK